MKLLLSSKLCTSCPFIKAENPFVSIYNKDGFSICTLNETLQKSCKLGEHLNGTVDIKKDNCLMDLFVFTLNVYLKLDFVHKVQ